MEVLKAWGGPFWGCQGREAGGTGQGRGVTQLLFPCSQGSAALPTHNPKVLAKSSTLSLEKEIEVNPGLGACPSLAAGDRWPGADPGMIAKAHWA